MCDDVIYPDTDPTITIFPPVVVLGVSVGRAWNVAINPDTDPTITILPPVVLRVSVGRAWNVAILNDLDTDKTTTVIRTIIVL